MTEICVEFESKSPVNFNREKHNGAAEPKRRTPDLRRFWLQFKTAIDVVPVWQFGQTMRADESEVASESLREPEGPVESAISRPILESDGLPRETDLARTLPPQANRLWT